ncbi:hypothetical protein [Microcoleus vaginatus]
MSGRRKFGNGLCNGCNGCQEEGRRKKEEGRRKPTIKKVGVK